MSSNREKLKNMGGPAFENDPKRVRPFGTFNPMQQERIITHMNTIGSKREEMHRLNNAINIADMVDIDSI
ncbi:MAG: hypothetical protein J6C34_01080 [Oscillospiraceae bacterium]|nr:hypothetical protein [Oscillospiraceae bacterium]MBP1574191.1 hypothetical protein [Oscillospiraceae bacterium]